MDQRRLRVALCTGLALGVLAIPTLALAAGRTTEPNSTLDIYFILTDKKIGVAVYAHSSGGTGELFLEPLQYVARGDVVHFHVINRGRKPHNFDFLGRKIAPLKPGAKSSFTATLIRRGGFRYSSTSGGADLRGIFAVR
jgi:hypothetical protein